MIKFKIDDMPDDERVKIVRLELCQEFDSDITVRATLENGTENYVISFRPDGTFYRHENVYIGFQVESNGRIVRREYE